MFTSVAFKRGSSDSTVYSVTDDVLSVTDPVVVSESVRTTGLQSIRYVTLQIINSEVYMAFSYYHNTLFRDWFSSDGVGEDAKGILITGQEVVQDSSLMKQIPYLVMHFRRTEEGVDSNLVPLKPSGCLVRSQWSFANTANSNKWSELKQAYRYRRAQLVSGLDDDYDNGFELITTKSKLRGRGSAFSLYMETEENKDCRIVGWNISLTGNTNA